MTDQAQQDLDNDRIVDTDRLVIPSFAGLNTLLASLQLDLPKGRIVMQVQVKTRYPFSADLIVPNRLQQQHLHPHPKQLLKLALGPTGRGLPNQTPECIAQCPVAGKMNIPREYKPKRSNSVGSLYMLLAAEQTRA